MKQSRKSRRISAAFMLICFLSTELLRPTGAAALPLPVTEIPLLNSFQIELPPELGTVETLVSGQGPTVIHIQEAHGDYESQRKIESILQFLKNQYGVDLLLLEGNAFELHTELLDFFPGRKDLNRAILEDLAQKQLASGPEFFLQEYPDTETWGIEEAQQYRENGQAFIQVLRERDRTEQFVGSMDLQIERLTSPYMSKDLRYFLKRLASFESSITPFAAWTSELKDFAFKYLEQDVSSPALQLHWPMLVRLFVLKEFEKKLDLGAFRKEKPAFFEELKAIPAEVAAEVERHLDASLSQNRLPDPETSILFENMVAALPADFDYSRFPNVTLYIGHLILQSELKGDLLFDEMTSLSDQVADKLAATSREKEIVSLLKQHRLLKRLLNLELTPRDYEHVKSAQGVSDPAYDLRPSAFVKQFEYLNRENLVKNYQFDHIEDVDALFENAVAFYQGAQERDSTMLEKIEERLESSGKKSAAVITGGFHAGPFKEFFESKGYNYALITPKMTDDVSKARKAYVGSVLANYIAPLSPAAATYRPVDYSVNLSEELEMQGVRASVVNQQLSLAITENARKAGVPNAEIQSNLRRLRAARQVPAAIAASEVRAVPGQFALRSLQKEFAQLEKDMKALGSSYQSRMPLREVRNHVKAVNELLGVRSVSSEAAIKAAQELNAILKSYEEQEKLAQSGKTGNQVAVYEVLNRIDDFQVRVTFLAETASELNLQEGLDQVELAVKNYLKELGGKEDFGLPALLGQLRQDYNDSGIINEVAAGELTRAFIRFYADRLNQKVSDIPDLETHPVVLKILALSPDASAARRYMDQFLTRGDGYNSHILKAQIRENILLNFARGEYTEASTWAHSQADVISRLLGQSLRWVDEEYPELISSLRVFSDYLKTAAARSEVRSGMSRREALRTIAAGLSLSLTTAAASAERPAVLTQEERVAKKSEEILKIARREKIDTVTAFADGLHRGSVGFSEEDASRSDLQDESSSRLASQFKWRRLVMEIAKDIVDKGFEAQKQAPEGQQTEPRVLSQQEVGELAIHLQTLKPEDIYGASLGNLPVLDKRDLRKLALFKDETSFLYQYARSIIKLQLGTGDRKRFADIMTWPVLNQRLNDYVSPEHRALAVKPDSPEAQLDREDLVFHLATVIFEMEVSNGAVPGFERGDAGYLVNNFWKNSNIKIIEVVEYFAYQKAAQRGVENAAADLIRRILGVLPKDKIGELRMAQKDKGLPPAEWPQGMIDDLLKDLDLQPVGKGDLGSVQDQVKQLGDEYKRINSSETLAAFLDRYAAKQEELRASLSRALLNVEGNKDLVERYFDAVAPATVYTITETQTVTLPNGRQVSRQVPKTNYYHLELLVDQHIEVFENDPGKLLRILVGNRNFVTGLNNNGQVSQDVKDRIADILRNNRKLFASLRSEVRFAPVSDTAVERLSGFTGGIASDRLSLGVRTQIASRYEIAPVIVTPPQVLSGRMQTELNRQDAVQAMLAQFASANVPLQILDDHQTLPNAEDLLDLVLLAQQVSGVTIAVTVRSEDAVVAGLIAKLDGLARKKLGVRMKNLSNFKVTSYGADQEPASQLGGYLAADVPTAILSAKESIVLKPAFNLGEQSVQSKLRVLVNNEKIHSDAVWAAVAAMLDEKVLAQLDRYQKATDLVASRLSAELQSQLKALRAFMSAA